MFKHIFALVVSIASINAVHAAQGNIDSGKGKAAMCAACHGANGIGATDAYPNLAGQHADYIVKQLKAFKSGDRKDAVMAPMAMGLSEQDMADVGAYFESLPRSGDAVATANNGDTTTAAVQAPIAYEPNAAAGKSLYELGDSSRSIGACIGCHGKEGNSDVLIYPNLSNQHPEYIEKQLHNFKNNTNRTNYAMNEFAAAMTDEDIADIGAYFADPAAVANVKARRVTSANVMSEDAIAGKAKAATCAACHGADGNSPATIYPKLAGQSATYLTKQLQEFKSGVRKDPVMAGMVAALSEQDMIELGAYFASQKSTPGNGEHSDLGEKLYLGGDAAKGITACIACHGINGQGMASAGFPGVANQNVEYLASQLTKFRTGERNNDKNAMMRNIAKKLKPADIEALTQYMSTLK